MNNKEKFELKMKIMNDFENYFISLKAYKNNEIIGKVLNNNLDIIRRNLVIIKENDLREYFRSEIIKMNFDNIEDYFNN